MVEGTGTSASVVLFAERRAIGTHIQYIAIKCVSTEAEENPESQNSTKALFSISYILSLNARVRSEFYSHLSISLFLN